MPDTRLDWVTRATDPEELRVRVEAAAADLDCPLDPSLAYSEQAARLERDIAARDRQEQDAPELAEMALILHAAQNRWFELAQR